jgi:hypothetical protein
MCAIFLAPIPQFKAFSYTPALLPVRWMALIDRKNYNPVRYMIIQDYPGSFSVVFLTNDQSGSAADYPIVITQNDIDFGQRGYIIDIE